MVARADAVAATRERIARAALALLLERAYEDVTLHDIADAAEVSHQTVLNRVGSKEGAALAGLELLRAEIDELRGTVRPGDPDSAVDVLMAQYERFGDANVRWAMSAQRLGRLAGLVDQARDAHHGWLGAVFDAVLPTDPDRRRRALHALHAATDVYTWKLLRRDLGLSRAETTGTMTALVRGVLGERQDR
jgi:AcrR family transcriptional regulator